MQAEPGSAEYRLDADAPRPLYLQLRDCIIADIRRGVFGVGSAIPSISALESNTRASRVTVVRALTRLVEDGFIFAQPGKGYYVAARGSKSLLAVVAPFDLRSMHYAGQVLAGVELAAGATGHDILEVNCGQTEQEFERAVRRALYERGAQSMVIVPPDDVAAHASTFLAKLPAPRIVIADGEVPGSGLPTVMQDRPAAYRLLAEHLAGIGARRVATTGFSVEAEPIHRALREAGLDVASDELNGNESADDIARACDALCCADDVIAARIYVRARDPQGRLPFALTGFNHTAHGHVAPGGLTTIDPGLVDIGMHAVRLITADNSGAPWRIRVAPRLIVGATTQQHRSTSPRTGVSS